MSIEVQRLRSPEWGDRIADLLDRKGFRFAERLVMDEIYVRRRGLDPDPTCLLPGVELSEPPPSGPTAGWTSIRGALQSFWQRLAPVRDLRAEGAQDLRLTSE